jgi:prepilin-type N-terminal cleavage/methylation domain-containing protein
MTKLNKGFTLIELLVVIAIIGILSGLIIVSMNSATKQANDARVQASLDQLRTAAQLYAINNNNVFSSTTEELALTACTSTASTFMTGDAITLCADAANYDTATPSIRIKADGTAYCAAFDLQAGTVWCVDSSGYAGLTSAVANCDATNFNCQ